MLEVNNIHCTQNLSSRLPKKIVFASANNRHSLYLENHDSHFAWLCRINSGTTNMRMTLCRLSSSDDFVLNIRWYQQLTAGFWQTIPGCKTCKCSLRVCEINTLSSKLLLRGYEPKSGVQTSHRIYKRHLYEKIWMLRLGQKVLGIGRSPPVRFRGGVSEEG
jgi:hypothetical protein